MIRFRTPGPIGEPELRAMSAAHVYARRHHCTVLPPDLAQELRVLGITVEPAWPDPDPTRRVRHEGAVA